ncbi:molybdate ABC transporter, permease protein [Rivularia sp. PCC 7116]|uniref:molybdate ABC transporter permease subunit n=1 Tax=Rivularia sp. PCC 7116 TaxID=373994 RepID=UPI00029EDF1B|nr:molybdate ABC transporter permease subunit [Rivularia sp. PCC 7116]AFY59105.1 molybdate ABC transporter, permease protein [Rivularia sp. PCC 7116]
MEFDLSPLWISLKTATVATLFAFFAGIAAAGWMKQYKGKAKGIIDGILTLPLVLPPTVVGFVLLLLFGINSPVGKLLINLEINVIFSWQATVITSTVVAFPLMYKTVLSSFEHIDNDLINCARTLGSSELKIFWLILLPLALPGIAAGTILAFARALGEFGATLMLAGSIPGKTQTMPIAIFFAAEAGDMQKALIWVLIMVAISLAVIATIHLWDESQRISKNRDGSANLIRSLINFVIFGQFEDVSFFENKREINKSLAFEHHSFAGKTRLRGLGIGGIDAGGVLAFDSATFLQEEVCKREVFSQDMLYSSSMQKSSINCRKELIVNIEKNLKSFQLQVNFTADRNTLGLLGASGSGKSMTLRCIAGLEKPWRGRIVLNGRVLFDAKRKINLPSRKRRIGFLFQNYALFPHMTVAQNIAFGLQELPKNERISKVRQYIDMMQLQDLENRYPHQISGGQQQRVALARALVIEPEAILLDEPLSALDTYLRNQIEKLLRKVLSSYQGATLFITHKLEEAYRVSSNIMVMSQGKVIANDTKENIFERSPNLIVAKVTECKNISRAEIVDNRTVKALDWNCNLTVVEPIPNNVKYLGIRAHHLRFSTDSNQENTFPCWVADISETQHRVSVYLKLNYPARDFEDYDLQVEIYKEKWVCIKERSFPWYVRLEAGRLMLMES